MFTNGRAVATPRFRAAADADAMPAAAVMAAAPSRAALRSQNGPRPDRWRGGRAPRRHRTATAPAPARAPRRPARRASVGSAPLSVAAWPAGVRRGKRSTPNQAKMKGDSFRRVSIDRAQKAFSSIIMSVCLRSGVLFPERARSAGRAALTPRLPPTDPRPGRRAQRRSACARIPIGGLARGAAGAAREMAGKPCPNQPTANMRREGSASKARVRSRGQTQPGAGRCAWLGRHRAGRGGGGHPRRHTREDNGRARVRLTPARRGV